MGEIAEALKRAKAEQESAEGVAPVPEVRHPNPAPADARPVPSSPTYDLLHDAEPPRSQSLANGLGAKESPDLVTLTHINPESQASQGVLVEGSGPVTEACRQLALRVRSELERRSLRGLAVVSAVRDEGKTVTSCNLALALATLWPGREVALVDLDLRRPSIEEVLELPRPKIGIEDVILGEHGLDEVAMPVIKPPIDLYPVCQAQAEAHELLILPGFAEMIRELEQRYKIVIYDTPPVLLVPDASLILHHVQAFAPVARAGRTRARAFENMISVLPRHRLLGEILNGGPRLQHGSDYGYYQQNDDDELEETGTSGDDR